MLTIRPETRSDRQAIYDLNRAAFGQTSESELVDKLRQTSAFIPELSIVAERGGKIVGHILFSKVTIEGQDQFTLLSLAPMAVLPDYQRQGIGLKMIRYGLKQARELGYGAVVVLGHPDYYPKAGFQLASHWGLHCPWAVPAEVWMALELETDFLQGKTGMVRFPEVFDEVV